MERNNTFNLRKTPNEQTTFINEFALNIVPLLAFVCICHATHYQNFMHSKAKQQTRRKQSLTLSLLGS